MKNRTCNLLASGANHAYRWIVFGRCSITKISLSQHLMMNDLNFKEKSLFWKFIKERDTFITLHPRFYTATICCCCFSSGHIFPIFSQSSPCPFTPPVIITLGLFFIKKLFLCFNQRWNNARKARKAASFKNKLRRTYVMGEDESICIDLVIIAKELIHKIKWRGIN